jgi:hypothetical protein
MKEGRDGVWVFDKEKVRQALKNQVLDIIPDGAGGFTYRVELPEALKLYNEALEVSTGALYDFASKLETQGYIWDTAAAKRARRDAFGILGGLETETTIIPPAGMRVPETAPMNGIFFAEDQPALFEKLQKGQDLVAGRIGADPIRTELFTSLGGGALLEYFLNIPWAIGIPSSTIANAVYKALTNPRDAVQTYQKVQGLLYRMEEGTNALTKYLTSNTKYVPRGVIGGILGKAVGSGDERTKDNITRDSVATGKALYDADKALLAKAQASLANGDIGSLNADYDVLDASVPKLSEAAGLALPRQVAFLAEKMQAATPAPQAFAIGNEPTSKALYQYGVYSRYVRNPDTIFDDIGNKGFVSSEAMEVLTRVYPARLNNLRTQLLSELSDAVSNKYRVNAKQQQIIDKILGTSTRGMTSAQIATLQKSFEKQTPAQGTGGGTSNRRVELERDGTSQGK